jgi:transcriptional regulator with XRE-family HTH domain
MQTTVRGGIAYQIQALRAKFDLTQAQFAQRTGKKQSQISRLEDTEYGRVSIQTLLDIASSLDLALLVRFVSYPQFLRCASNMSESNLQPETVYESFDREEHSRAEPDEFDYSGPLAEQTKKNYQDNIGHWELLLGKRDHNGILAALPKYDQRRPDDGHVRPH